MARGSQEREQAFIETAKPETGHTIDEWMAIIEAAGLDLKPNTILKHLKANHDLNHMQANYLAGMYLNDGQPVYDYAVLYARLYDGKDHLRPLIDTLQAQADALFDDVVFVPTRNYISIEGHKIFACAKLTKKSVRVGLDLGDIPFEGRVQKAKGLGAMPNLSHMIEIDSVDDIDDAFLGSFRHAFDRVHNS